MQSQVSVHESCWPGECEHKGDTGWVNLWTASYHDDLFPIFDYAQWIIISEHTRFLNMSNGQTPPPSDIINTEY